MQLSDSKGRIFRILPQKTDRQTAVPSGPYMYKLVRNLLFLFPAETVHYASMHVFRWICRIPPVRRFVTRHASFSTGSFQQEVAGLSFSNPVGLGAGFDKNAIYLNELRMLGFGFVEIGTVTPQAQRGNKRPRLFRLPEEKALLNRMGFNNEGLEKIAGRLRKWRAHSQIGSSGLIIGGNIGKNKDTPNEEAWRDYLTCFEGLAPWVDYFVINLSSPNTPGLRELQEKNALRKILSSVQEANRRQPGSASGIPRPLLLKIAPDLDPAQLDDIIDLAMELKLEGIVAANTTIDRGNLGSRSRHRGEKFGAGGLSGAPLKKKSTDVIRHIYQRSGGSLTIIGSGGVFTSQDADEKLKAGASLVQVWTGFIYEGPFIVRRILENLTPGGQTLG
jgi:dihydroorotate dehydrogenase